MPRVGNGQIRLRNASDTTAARLLTAAPAMCLLRPVGGNGVPGCDLPVLLPVRTAAMPLGVESPARSTAVQAVPVLQSSATAGS